MGRLGAARRAHKLSKAENIDAPIIDQMIGNSLSPICTVSTSGSPANLANQLPISDSNESQRDRRQTATTSITDESLGDAAADAGHQHQNEEFNDRHGVSPPNRYY